MNLNPSKSSDHTQNLPSSDLVVEKRSFSDQNLASVSIVTITQLSRYECLLILYDLIKSQTYTNILEWVIVEGSPNEIDGEKNKTNIKHLQDSHSHAFDIVYIHYTNKKLSDLRNLGNDFCKGDIIVCMDDDDYYPKERVKHAVESLENSSKLLAGCTDIYLYEYGFEKLYKCFGFHQNHSTNNAMAYRREYLINHRYESGLTMAEEVSFTNNFTEPMVQLNSKKSVVVSSHTHNTVDKKPLCIRSLYGKSCLYEVNEDVIQYIPIDIFHKMRTNFYTFYDRNLSDRFIC
jgi:glycosyltransferase involved in cell wall biosynthesis